MAGPAASLDYRAIGQGWSLGVSMKCGGQRLHLEGKEGRRD